MSTEAPDEAALKSAEEARQKRIAAHAALQKAFLPGITARIKAREDVVSVASDFVRNGNKSVELQALMTHKDVDGDLWKCFAKLTGRTWGRKWISLEANQEYAEKLLKHVLYIGIGTGIFKPEAVNDYALTLTGCGFSEDQIQALRIQALAK